MNATNPLAGLILKFRAWMSEQPPWVHVAVAVAAMIFGSLTDRACTRKPTPAPVAPAEPVAYPAPPAELVGATEARGDRGREWRVGHHVFADSARGKVEDELRRNGFALVGGDARPLSADRAERLARRLSDDTVIGAGQSVGVFKDVGDGSDGPLQRFIQRLRDWIDTHPEQWQAILKLLLTVLLAFI